MGTGSRESGVETALDELAKAHGSAALTAAFHRLQRQVRAARARSRKTFGILAQTYMAAMASWDAQKAAGVTLAERYATLERTFRAAWPLTREWKFLCAACDDYGLAIGCCPGDTTCGRTKPHGPHEFGAPCFCKKGDRFRQKTRPIEDYTAATKVGKPTRIGR